VRQKKGNPDPTPTKAEKRTASRYYQLKSRHTLTGVLEAGKEQTGQSLLVVRPKQWQ